MPFLVCSLSCNVSFEKVCETKRHSERTCASEVFAMMCKRFETGVLRNTVNKQYIVIFLTGYRLTFSRSLIEKLLILTEGCNLFVFDFRVVIQHANLNTPISFSVFLLHAF
jgi:hypothetical protein